jgi:hypothetical protein
MLSHRYLEEFQCFLLVARLCDVAFQRLTLVIDGAPEVVPLAVDLHKHFVEMPLSTARLHPLNPALPDPRSEHRAKSIPPEPDSLLADLNSALVQQVLHVTPRLREPDVQLHR